MPAFCTVNGSNVAEGLVAIPRIGVWHADLSVDGTQAATGTATVTLGQQTLVGTFARSGVDLRGRVQVRVVGGANGLASTLQPKSYRSIPLRIPLSDSLRDAGETLSPTADTAILNTQLTAWSRMAQAAGSALAALVQVVPNAVWRVLLDGTVWVGFETWPVVSVPDAVAVRAEPELRRLTVAFLTTAVLPGQAFQYLIPQAGTFTARVGHVQHHIRRGEVRTVLLTET